MLLTLETTPFEALLKRRVPTQQKRVYIFIKQISQKTKQISRKETQILPVFFGSQKKIGNRQEKKLSRAGKKRGRKKR